MMSRGASKYTMFGAVIVAEIVMIIVQGTVPAQAGLSAADCKAERHEGVNACKRVVYGMMPSDQCCKWILGAHMEECVCPIIDKCQSGGQACSRLQPSGPAPFQMWQHHYSVTEGTTCGGLLGC